MKFFYIYLLFSILISENIFSEINIENNTNYNVVITYQSRNSFSNKLVQIDPNTKINISSKSKEIFCAKFYFYQNNVLYSATFGKPFFFICDGDNLNILKTTDKRFAIKNQNGYTFCLKIKKNEHFFLHNNSKYNLEITLCEDYRIVDIQIKPWEYFKIKNKFILCSLGSKDNIFHIKPKMGKRIKNPGLYSIDYNEVSTKKKIRHKYKITQNQKTILSDWYFQTSVYDQRPDYSGCYNFPALDKKNW